MALFQYFRRRLQWRLTLILSLLLIVSIIILGVFLARAWQSSLKEEIIDSEELFVANQTSQINNFLDTAEGDVRFLASMGNVQALALALANNDTEAIAQLKNRVEQDFLALSQNRGIYNQVRFFNTTGDELVRVDFDGTNFEVVTGNALQNKADRGYFTGTIGQPDGQLYISRLDLNREGTPPTIQGSLTDDSLVPVLRYGTPVYVTPEDSNQPVLAGAVVTNIFARSLLQSSVRPDPDVETFLIDQDGYFLLNTANPRAVFGFEPDIDTVGGISEASVTDAFAVDVAESFLEDLGLHNLETSQDLVVYQRIVPPGAPANYYWVLIETHAQDAVFATVNEAGRNAVLVAGALILVSIALIAFSTRQLTRPIVALSRSANAIAGGDLSTPPPVIQRPDEIGVLSEAFGSMTKQLVELVTGLEARIENRTRDLQTVADVNAEIATVLDLDRLLQDVVDLTKERFNLYHAHVYLLTQDQRTLLLTAGAGHVGRQMVSEQRSIAINNPDSIVAEAARSREAVTIDDVRQSPLFLPHPLLPETRSELAIPLVARGQLIGVLDVQDEQVGYFTEENRSVLELLAGQVSIALSNAQLYETASRTSRHEQALGRISAGLQTANSVDEVLQIAVKELGKALRVPHTAIELRTGSNGGNDEK